MTEASRVARAVSQLGRFADGKDPASGAAQIVLDRLAYLEKLLGPPTPGEPAVDFPCSGCGRDVDPTERHLVVVSEFEQYDPDRDLVSVDEPRVVAGYHPVCVPAAETAARTPRAERDQDDELLPVLDHEHTDLDAGGNCRDPRCGFNSDVAQFTGQQDPTEITKGGKR